MICSNETQQMIQALQESQNAGLSGWEIGALVGAIVGMLALFGGIIYGYGVLNTKVSMGFSGLIKSFEEFKEDMKKPIANIAVLFETKADKKEVAELRQEVKELSDTVIELKTDHDKLKTEHCIIHKEK